jgi:excisionase family DNA binding protein
MDYSNKQRIIEPSGDNKRVYTVDEIAAILRVSRTSAYRFVKSGKFKAVYVGTMLRISKESFDEWLKLNRI